MGWTDTTDRTNRSRLRERAADFVFAHLAVHRVRCRWFFTPTARWINSVASMQENSLRKSCGFLCKDGVRAYSLARKVTFIRCAASSGRILLRPSSHPTLPRPSAVAWSLASNRAVARSAGFMAIDERGITKFSRVRVFGVRCLPSSVELTAPEADQFARRESRISAESLCWAPPLAAARLSFLGTSRRAPRVGRASSRVAMAVRA